MIQATVLQGRRGFPILTGQSVRKMGILEGSSIWPGWIKRCDLCVANPANRWRLVRKEPRNFCGGWGGGMEEACFCGAPARSVTSERRRTSEGETRLRCVCSSGRPTLAGPVDAERGRQGSR